MNKEHYHLLLAICLGLLIGLIGIATGDHFRAIGIVVLIILILIYLEKK